MAFIFDEVWVNNGQLMIADEDIDKPKALGEGVNRVKHSAYIEGPLQVGNSGDFTEATATVMIGKDGNTGSDNALSIKGDTSQIGDTVQTGDVSITGNITKVANISSSATVSAKVLTAPSKPFDIEHPSKEKWRLRYACIEGPENGVYYRGRLKNQKKIVLPKYWKDLVVMDSITVQLQPIGAHQDSIVKRWDDENIYLQAQGGLPINCFYHVYAERKDVAKLITEYEGESIDDYPG